MGWWHLVVFGIFVAALALQVYATIPFTSFVAGVVAFATALVTEQHIDTVVRRRMAIPAPETQTND